MIIDFENEILYHYADSKFTTTITASLTDGKLHFSGTEFDESAEAIFGKGDYDYSISILPEDTLRFISLIDGIASPLDTLRSLFGNQDCALLIRQLCEKNDIRYEYSKYC